MPRALIFASEKNILVEELLKQLREKQCNPILVSTFDLDTLRKSEKPDYVFLIYGIKNIDKIFEFITEINVKTEVLLPYVICEEERGEIERIALMAAKTKNDNLNIIYAGEIFGKGMNLEEGALAQVFRGIVPRIDFDIYVISVKSLVDTILKGTFSYGFENREFVIANKFSVLDLANKIKKFLKVSFVVSSSFKPPSTVSNFDFISPKFKMNELAEVAGISEIRIPTQKQIVVVKKNKIKNVSKTFAVLIILFLWIVGFPFLSFFVASAALRTGFSELGNYDFQKSKILFDFSKYVSTFSKISFGFWDDGRRMENLLRDYSNFGIEASLGLDRISKITDLTETDDIYFMMDSLYKRITLIDADMKEILRTSLMPNVNLDELSNLIGNGKELVRSFPQIFGATEERKYLVLIQDSSEIRATGGKIKSFEILTFKAGKLIERKLYDSKYLDTQFKGYVAPPQVLSRYLGVSNWSFSDSNWEIDFESSAKRAEWFLKNGMNVDVDGVIGVDIKTWSEINKFRRFFDFARVALKLFDEKKIQIFSNSEIVENEIKNLGWDGGMNFPVCEHSCTNLSTSLVETNLGKNNIDNFITRNVNLDVKVDGNVFYNKLQIGIYNPTGQVYRDYLRLTTPKNSNFKMISGLTVISRVNDEAQYYIDVLPGQTRQVTFEWTRAFSGKKVLLYFRKQPGVNMPLSLTFESIAKYNTILDKDFEKEIEI